MVTTVLSVFSFFTNLCSGRSGLPPEAITGVIMPMLVIALSESSFSSFQTPEANRPMPMAA